LEIFYTCAHKHAFSTFDVNLWLESLTQCEINGGEQQQQQLLHSEKGHGKKTCYHLMEWNGVSLTTLQAPFCSM
jgi:hypothetical protein